MKNVVYVCIDTRKYNYTDVLNINNKRLSIRRVALRCDAPIVKVSTNGYLNSIKLLNNIQSEKAESLLAKTLYRSGTPWSYKHYNISLCSIPIKSTSIPSLVTTTTEFYSTSVFLETLDKLKKLLRQFLNHAIQLRKFNISIPYLHDIKSHIEYKKKKSPMKTKHHQGFFHSNPTNYLSENTKEVNQASDKKGSKNDIK